MLELKFATGMFRFVVFLELVNGSFDLRREDNRDGRIGWPR